ncbi:MAG TPA: nuclear transport factor 2 family protein [Flavitalea sp.]|nr:nuclear transport factor 2 family protein [Flavitalea sp.]
MNKRTQNTEAIIRQFNDAFQQHDPSLLTDLIGPSCVMESIQGPEGIRYEGYDACFKFWHDLANDRGSHFDVEEINFAGNRATIRWKYYWGDGKDQSVRGVNLMLVESGKIVEALGYAKTVPTTGLDS